jgi:hypothetical protein
LLAIEAACANLSSRVYLRLGEHSMLHVGQIAILQTSSAHKYTITLNGEALAPFEGTRQKPNQHFYRAVRPGNATLLIAPADLRNGECVSCVTRHCFISVIP